MTVNSKQWCFSDVAWALGDYDLEHISTESIYKLTYRKSFKSVFSHYETLALFQSSLIPPSKCYFIQHCTCWDHTTRVNTIPHAGHICILYKGVWSKHIWSDLIWSASDRCKTEAQEPHKFCFTCIWPPRYIRNEHSMLMNAKIQTFSGASPVLCTELGSWFKQITDQFSNQQKELAGLAKTFDINMMGLIYIDTININRL